VLSSFALIRRVEKQYNLHHVQEGPTQHHHLASWRARWSRYGIYQW